MQNNDLEKLRGKRLNWVTANRENGFDEGINRLLTELYPDNAHFIYELLQNAEDPKATEVQFKLTDSAVAFTHNGKRLFVFKDVESITSIGNSTKRDDATSIGKFGIGFKAVFAYTNTPEIHSGDFHFRIHDLVVPETKNIEQSPTEKTQTRFVFPFDNPKKLPTVAVHEIEKGLCELTDNTLLFLSHIRKIDYTLPDGSQGSLQRIKRKDGRTEIHANHPHNEPTVSHWLHFEKDVQVADDDGKYKTCRVATAYQFEQNTGKNKDQSTWKIVPVTGGGQVSIYFPAVKETSKLHFHLHAPFASTIERSSVCDRQANEPLRDHIAELVVESLTAIRDQGLLNMSFLAVLPNKKDELAKFYEPIRLAIVDAFKTQSLTPTKSGTHLASTKLYRGTNKISDVINDDDLSILTDYETPLWAANAPQRNQREDNFLDSLEIDKWDFEQLSAIFKPADKEKIESWLATKPDNWMMDFYELLLEAKENHEKSQIRLPSWQKTIWSGLSFPLVRVESTQGIKHVIANQAYFAPEDNNILPSADTDIVKLSVYSKGKTSDDINHNAKTFLQKINVEPFNAKTVIELRLKHYQSPPKQITDEHYEDIKQFINYWQNSKDKTLFQSVSFLLVTANDKLYWQKATDICLDNPFIETGLAELIDIHQKKFLWQGYSEKLNKNELNDFVEFIKAIGVMHKLEVIKLTEYQAKENPNNPYNNTAYRWNSSTGVAEDYSIPELKSYLTAKKVSASGLIWNALINTPFYMKNASFQSNRSYLKQTVDSQLIYHLKNHAWIPNKSGEFCTPQAMTRETLPPDFPFNDSNGFLTAIEFGKEEKERAEALSRQDSAYQAKNTKAQELGFKDAEQAERIARLTEGLTDDEIVNKLSPRNSIELPTNPVRNTDRRRKAMVEHRENAPSKESITRERSIQSGVTEDTVMARAYLRAIYENIDKQLICQLCREVMPFKIKESYYFVAVQCVRNVDKHYYENRLALCPTCAAMYKHTRNTTCDEITKLIIDHDAPETTPSVEISVIVTGENRSLYFVGTHWFDLKTILEK